jgi:hypothetical protein
MPPKLAKFYVRLIEELGNYHRFCRSETKIRKILELIVKVNPSVLHISIDCNNLEHYYYFNNGITSLDLISHLIIKRYTSITNIPNDETHIYIYLLLEYNFTSKNIQPNEITPLTTLMLSCYHSNYWIKIHYDNVFFQFLLKNGFDVNSRSLDNYPQMLQTHSSYCTEEMKIKLLYGIPDVLFLAVRSVMVDVAYNVLKHWWGPPLLLITILPIDSYRYKLSIDDLYSKWLPLLLEFGGVPHGITFYRHYKNIMLYWIKKAKTSENYIKYLPVVKKCTHTLCK